MRSQLSEGESPSRALLFREALLHAIVALALLALTCQSYAQSILYVVNQGSNDVSVVDTHPGIEKVIKTIPGPGLLLSTAFNPANGLIYLPTNDTAGQVYLINTATNSVVGSPFPGVGPNAIYMSISAELNRGYVSNYFGAGVSVVDVTTNTVIANIPTGFIPIGSAFDPNLDKAYVVNNGGQSVSVIKVSTNAVINTISGMGPQPAGIGIDTVAHKAVVARSDSFALAMIDTITDTVVATLTVPGKPQYVVVDSATHRAYALYTTPGGIAVVDTSANALVMTFALGAAPGRLAIDPALNRLYVTDGQRNSVFVVDTTTNTIPTEIPVGIAPVDIAIVPAGGLQNPFLIPRSSIPLPPLLVSPAVGTPTKHNLVMLVHGWNSDASTWAIPIAQKIVDRINIARGGQIPLSEEWRVGWYDWHERAGEGCTKLGCFLPPTAFAYSYAEGLHLGHQLATAPQAPNGWDHIHFIAHSAGSNLVQIAATDLLANAAKRPKSVHMTFLDAYYPFGQGGTSAIAPYGLGATWAEHYFDHRDNAEGFLADTNRQLPLAYDFDVTAIDKRPLGTGGLLQIPHDLAQAHAWPYLWYGCVLDSSIVYDERRTCTTDQTLTPDYASSPYGPKLALEYGSSSLPNNVYSSTARDPKGGDLLCTLTTGSEACPTSSSTVTFTRTLNLTNLLQFAIDQAHVVGVSATGTVSFIPRVQLTTASPAWVTFRNTTTEPFDTVQLDYQFLSYGKGLLSVYVDDLMVFVAEEVDAGGDIQHTPLIPVGTLAPGGHTLALRLDPQTADQSIVQVSGVQTGTAKLVLVGDLDGDGDVDLNDLNILLRDLNKPVGSSLCGARCDLNGDGKIDALDARKLQLLCTRPRCATQ